MKGGPTRVLIKVTYLDDRDGEWWIEYDAGADAAWKKSRPVQNTHDGQWKTATVELPDAAFENRQRGWADFCITRDGTEDLTVRFVRLIKAAPPNSSPGR